MKYISKSCSLRLFDKKPQTLCILFLYTHCIFKKKLDIQCVYKNSIHNVGGFLLKSRKLHDFDNNSFSPMLYHSKVHFILSSRNVYALQNGTVPAIMILDHYFSTTKTIEKASLLSPLSMAFDRHGEHDLKYSN